MSQFGNREVGVKAHISTALPAVLVVVGLVSVAQAQQAQTIAPTRFEDAIQAFEAEDQAMMPPQGAILITGSSSIRRWHPSMKADLAPLTVIPRGFGGSAMADVLHFVDRLVIPYAPRAVVIYEGDNDTGRDRPPPVTIASELERIVSKIHAAVSSHRQDRRSHRWRNRRPQRFKASGSRLECYALAHG